jgi:hypothetical protein
VVHLKERHDVPRRPRDADEQAGGDHLAAFEQRIGHDRRPAELLAVAAEAVDE